MPILLLSRKNWFCLKLPESRMTTGWKRERLPEEIRKSYGEEGLMEEDYKDLSERWKGFTGSLLQSYGGAGRRKCLAQSDK